MQRSNGKQFMEIENLSEMVWILSKFDLYI